MVRWQGGVLEILIINLLVPSTLGSICLWSASSLYPPPGGRDLSSCRATQRYVRLLHISFSLLLHSLSTLQLRRPRRLKFFLQTRNRRHGWAFVPGRALQSLVWFWFTIFFDTPPSLGEQGQDKKGNRILDGEVNHKQSRETVSPKPLSLLVGYKFGCSH